MKKRILTMLLVLGLLAGNMSAGAISGDYDRNARECAVLLYNYGLLDGTGTLADGTIDFSLERPMTRGEAITMVVRLTGGREEALSGGYSHPFTDVDSWGTPMWATPTPWASATGCPLPLSVSKTTSPRGNI